MNTSPNHNPSKYRKNHHLNLTDVAYLLDMDQGNLSRFEAGKSSNPKALLGYHYLFNLSIGDDLLGSVIHSNDEIVHRCFNLIEETENKPKTKKNDLRVKGLDEIVSRLMTLQENHEANQ